VTPRRTARACARASAGLAALLLAALLLTAHQRARLVSPDPTLLLRDRHGAFLGEVGADDEGAYGYWPVDPLPHRVAAAVIAIEDRSFWRHPGVDPRGVARAAVQNVSAGERISGASTLAMQIARMQRPGERTWRRKIVEATTALFLTARYSRAEILAHYLTIVPFGNRVQGIGYASRRYLDKPVQDLSWAETAFLAAIPQAPSTYNPYTRDGRARASERALRILALLHAEGAIDDAELSLARAELVDIAIPPRRPRPQEALHAVLRLESTPRDARPHLDPLGESLGDPLVHTSLDLTLQRELTWLLGERVAGWADRGAGQGALMVVSRETGEVLAAVGSTDYDAPLAGSVDFTRTPRYPGSTLKPLVYALALDRGTLSPTIPLDDLGHGPEGIGNADGRFLGPLLPRRALANSRNVPAVAVMKDVGLEASYAFFRTLALHEDELPVEHYGLGLAIGGMPVTLEQLVSAYGALANDGVQRELSWVRGEAREGRRVLTEASARQVGLWLSDPMARLPSFPRMGFSELPFPVAIKTGTSEEYRDAWAVGWSEDYIVGAWVGHPDWQPMKQLSGYRGGASLVSDVMRLLHADKLDGTRDGSLPPPDGYTQAPLCALSGRAATDACDHVVTEWVATAPEPCEAHQRWLVDARTGAPAHTGTPERFRREAVVVDLPPRYADWVSRAGLPRAPTDSGVAASPMAITAPMDGAQVMIDPEVPAEQATLALRAAVAPDVEQVVWYVDGEPYAVADHPFTLRWPLTPGEHRFQVRLPFGPERSPAVSVRVQ